MDPLSDFLHMENLRPEKEIADSATCPFCGGSGIVANEKGEAIPCVCYLAQIRTRQLARANLSPLLQQKTFANFDLRYYPEYRKTPKGISYRKLAEEAVQGGQQLVAALVEGRRHGKGLMFTGPVGCGKTHLAAACANELLTRQIDVLFLVVPDFLDDLRSSYSSQGEFSEATLMRRAKSVPILILDDLGAHNFSQWTQNKLFSLLNHRVNQQLPCIVTSNLGLSQLEEIIGQRTTSRLVEACNFRCLEVERDIRLSKSFEEP